MVRLWSLLALALLVSAACGAADESRTAPDYPAPAVVAPAGAQPIPYGPGARQFGNLYLPAGEAPLPVVVLVHGGFWQTPFSLDLMEPLADDLVARGYAVWNITYRRVGDRGGGWPGTFEDVAAAVDHLRFLADEHQLDLTRLAVVGHSAGGHMALWSAARSELPDAAPGADPAVVPTAVVGLAPVVDLQGAADAFLGRGAVESLIGGTVERYPDRFAWATPSLTTGVETVVVHGAVDTLVPPAFGVHPDGPGDADIRLVDGADHFDVIDPTHPAWAMVVEVLERYQP